MTAESGGSTGDAAALAAAVLDEEARRQAAQLEREREPEIGDDELPGVGGEDVGMREVLRSSGYGMVVTLSALVFADELDRAAFAILGPDIQRSLRLTDLQLGLVGAIGGLLLFAAAVPIGYLADRVRRTLVVGVSSAMFAAFAALTGGARSVWQLVAVRTAGGIAKANEVPVHSALLADAYPIEARSRIYAIHRGAQPVGRVVGPLLAGTVAAAAGGAAGWRWVFVVIGVPSAIFAAFAFVLREPRRGHNEQMAVLGAEIDATVDELPISLGAGFARLKKIKTFYFFLTMVATLGFAFVTTPIYLNLILERRFGQASAERGIVGAVTAIGALLGVIVAGRYGDRLFREAPEKTVRMIAAAVAAYGLILPAAIYMPNIALFTVLNFVGQAVIFGAFVPANAVVAAVTPYRLRSLGFAMIGIYLSLVGGVGGAIIAGGISDALGEQAALAIVVPPATLLGALLMAYGARYVRRDIALTVADLKEEQEEHRRVASGAEIPVLQVRHLDFSYGHVQVLFDVDLDVREGEVLALLGTNGAGKSTLLRAVSGLGVPDRGVVRLQGRTITYADPRTRVRMGIVQVPGGKAVFPSLTVAENLVAGAYTYVWERERVRERAEGVLALFPVLAERMDQAAGTLSGGEQQMLAVAKALLLDPKVLLIDELSLGLAPVVVQELLGIVEQLKERGITMIVVEQSVNVALSIADRAVFMEKGRVRFTGPAQELLERDDLVRAVFLGGEGG